MSNPHVMGDVLTIKQLEEFARTLAEGQKISPVKRGNLLLARLGQNQDLLSNTYHLIRNVPHEGHSLSPAAEWLLDNFYLIDEQIRTIRRHLPEKYNRELSALDTGHPRIYAIAREFVSHTDGRLEGESLQRFITAYQETKPACILKLGELWAVPIMLRLALIENLRHVAEYIAAHYIDQVSAKHWAYTIIKKSQSHPKGMIVEIADLARSNPRLSSVFIAEFARGIQSGCANPTLPLSWIEQQAAEHGLSLEDHQHLVSKQHAHNQLSISNSINSLRYIDSTDWRDFVESMSWVEGRLRQDPSGIYPKMDFLTRDIYRHVIEYSARHSYASKKDNLSELEVADIALELSQEHSKVGGWDIQGTHIGEYLIGKGRTLFEERINIKLPFVERFRRFLQDHSLWYYLGSQIFFIILLVWWPLQELYRHLQPFSSQFDHKVSFVLFVLGLVCISTSAAVAIVNFVTTLFLKPKPWLRFDFSEGVPRDCRTLVAIPSMLNNSATIEQLVSDLEIRFLGNQDENIKFALLTDFVDAHSEITKEDEELLVIASRRIEELNAKYGSSHQSGPFYLLHRPRRWNPSEGVWMGWERKRGKLMDLNAYLRGRAPNSFMTIIGDQRELQGVKYVITLDADTILPRDSARQLIATIAHPLNRAKIDQDVSVVREGYAILQPRVTTHHQNLNASFLTRLTGDRGGIDPYTQAVSDVYQDLFQEGSFIGKGIYDIDAFTTSTDERFPENRILSHDLIEGCFARCGLVSDVQLVEEDPAAYSSDAKRRHRWMRGDWQISPWLFPVLKRDHDANDTNPLSALSRWKVFDNLRRSLVPSIMLGLLLFSWYMGGNFPRVIALSVIVYLFLPNCLVSFRAWGPKSSNISLRMEMLDWLGKLARGFAISLLNLAFLPYDAFLALDAMIRSLYRLIFSKKHLLEWCTAADSKRRSIHTPQGYYLFMWILPVLSAAILVLVEMGIFSLSIPLLVLSSVWFFAPLLAWGISRPLPRRKFVFSQEDEYFLKILTRRTWQFFTTFVTAIDNWLPPDNFQEFPHPVIAHRTSPTNIGLGLLSTLAAYDFGYIGVQTLIERLENTIKTLESLPRYKGHFYNWYDTENLEPLHPLYVSTVDSGNLLGSFIILRQGLIAIASESKLRSKRIASGISDIFYVLDDVVAQHEEDFSLLMPEFKKLRTECLSPVLSEVENPSHVLLWVQSIWEQLSHIKVKLTQLYPSAQDVQRWLLIFIEQMEDHLRDLQEEEDLSVTESLRQRLWHLSEKIESLSDQDYEFLYNPSNKHLVIGYHVAEARPDHSYYDLLASEARLASFLAIALGHLPQEHWFSLGRQLTAVGGGSTLLSWSGSMFEYLMPNLFLPTYKGTLLDQTCRLCVKRQIQYAQERKVVWGISESGYNAVDAQFNYQYRAFGVPGLGFKRDLDMDLVVAPYATVMALMVDPEAALANLKRMSKCGYMGEYGFYEAIDFTRSRVPPNANEVVIKSFMAHHQGMGFLSLASLLLDEPMQRRMEEDPRFKATELLLQERVPRERPAFAHTLIDSEITQPQVLKGPSNRVLTNPNRSFPEAHLLSNGHFQTIVTSAGGGYSKWKDLMLTRWYPDETRDSLGSFIYIREPATNKVWSAGYQPMLVDVDSYAAIFSEGRAEFRRLDYDLDIHTEIVVSPDDDAEVRRITITNPSHHVREIEITTYAEVVLSPLASDIAHPAFNKLFVETEIMPHLSGIVCRRRARIPGEEPPWLGHAVVVYDALHCETSFETDRNVFIGRKRSMTNPHALTAELQNTQGAVLDPIIAIRKKIRIPAAGVVNMSCILGVAKDKDHITLLLERIQEQVFSERTIELALAHDNMLLRQINASSHEAMLFGKMLSPLVYGGSAFRALPSIIKRNTRSQSSLWGYGISGDLPIILLRIGNQENLVLLQQVVRAHAYWRLKGFAVDLVIWNEDDSGYRQLIHDGILQAIAGAEAANVLDKPGGIFLRRPDQMAEEDRRLLQSVARLILSDQAGGLEEQINSKKTDTAVLPEFLSIKNLRSKDLEAPAVRELSQYNNLLFANTFGGFTQDGREYVIRTTKNQKTPAPWVNIMANADFGTMVTESGSSFTWSENASEHRLTPWSNDPVMDPSGECLFLRDEVSGVTWSPTPAPIAGNDKYTVAHGFGYTTFYTGAFAIETELVQFVAHDAPVKFFLLKISNKDKKRRHLSATLYLEPVLGNDRSKTKDFIVTECDPFDMPQPSMFARNVYASVFAGRTIFLTATKTPRSVTGDRTEFIGRNSSTACPLGMNRAGLSGRVGTLLDPCLAMQIDVELLSGETTELAFVFGCAKSAEEARGFIKRFATSAGRVRTAFDMSCQHWLKILSGLQIQTPDPALNILGNGWLLYQTLSSRFWGRTSFYQPGGGYGFRDQLQDAMSLLYTAPQLAKEQILLCARHQFVEGDVQHWWHPPLGNGVRTRFSDDYLWLPYVTSQYIRVTGDTSILDESMPFIEQALLSEHEESNYSLPTVTDTVASLYEHCARAIRRSMKVGSHGLPLMGAGDWNDGMNLVGIHGQGESVWMAFFLYETLQRFTEIAKLRQDEELIRRSQEHAELLKKNIEANTWDGAWYARAFFDDGSPIGVSGNDECYIDSLPQSWSVLSQASTGERQKIAMESVYKHLVRENDSLILVLNPPFNKSNPTPGYIAGYLPGVRENGGQYTHAALWVIMAYAQLGDFERAMQLLTLIDPVRQGENMEFIHRYKVEPYVISADVYNNPSHVGRGGWSWYTGAAAWFYRVIIESILGFELRGDQLKVNPRIPKHWNGFQLKFQYYTSTYNLHLQRDLTQGSHPQTWVDEILVKGEMISLQDDGGKHQVKIIF